jgi:hypothetical protein
VKLRKAITVTLDDWLRRDPEMPRGMWIGFTLAIMPLLPLVIVWRLFYEEPERL